MSPSMASESTKTFMDYQLVPIIKQKNRSVAKWDILFDKKITEWISFKPEIGLFVYPCYACRDMFASKSSFQDHTNRRLVLIQYNCSNCKETLTFFNRCSFLLHARSHFNPREGYIDFTKIEIYALPIGLAGFMPFDGIKSLYDEMEDTIGQTFYINSLFYHPMQSERGKHLIKLKPYNLTFCYQTENQDCYLALRQLSGNIPHCQFVNVEDLKKLRASLPLFGIEVQIKEEPLEEPIVEEEPRDQQSQEIIDRSPECPECHEKHKESMKNHFLGQNIPFNETWKCQVCRYIASTVCSLSAHCRIHSKEPPFVCPECGKKFSTHNGLLEHIDEVCFHLAKHVKFKCSGKRCGKLFSSQATYQAHFGQHLQMCVQCSVCKEDFKAYEAFRTHSLTCSVFSQPSEVYRCMTLKCSSNFVAEKHLKKHIEYHCQDRSRCMYVFICKYCRNYFRSTATYAAHLIKCPKNTKQITRDKMSSSSCSLCRSKIFYHPNDTAVICSYCEHLNKLNEPKKPSDIYEEINLCILCDKELTDEEVNDHPSVCDYRDPQVHVKNLEFKEIEKYLDKIIMESEEEPTENPLKRKKKKQLLPCPKKPEVEEYQPEEPLIFDGTYYCKHCDFKETDRDIFQRHIIEHRDISTSYQCMDCGECFVVKPSLIKHLRYYHKIEDIDDYLEINECFDKNAVEELKEVVMNAAPGDVPKHVGENQCRVCFHQCEDDATLQKHLRNHGMAFLRTNTLPLK